MLLSVIVPAYNVERYLPRCLESLLRQGLGAGEYEIICVNDGSSDNSALVLTDYVSLYPNIIRVLHQRHQGLAHARNAGVAAARGEYIAFVDSDDYVVEDAYRYLLDHFCGRKPDVVMFDHQEVHTYVLGDFVEHEHLTEGEAVFEGKFCEAKLLSDTMAVWSKLYRRAFLQKHGISFQPIFCEDLIYNFQVFQKQPYMVRTNCMVYYFEQQHEASLIHERRKDLVKVQLGDLLYGIQVMNTYLQEGHTLLATLARENVSAFVRRFCQKLFSSFYTRREWSLYVGRLRQLPIHTVSDAMEQTALGKGIVRLYNLSLRSYPEYLLVWLIHRAFFRKNNFVLRPHSARMI
ncbi:MAG: glycosyltransferase [Bacteroidaceae bacterium]|nr:glycosyltransferase [Bacteroidaceae bacterium]